MMQDPRAGTMSSPHGGGVVTAVAALLAAFVAITTAPTCGEQTHTHTLSLTW